MNLYKKMKKTFPEYNGSVKLTGKGRRVERRKGVDKNVCSIKIIK